MSFQDILNKSYHCSIIYLLQFYENQKDNKDGKIRKKGLRQLHFRYALMDEPNIYRDTLPKVRAFFNEYDKTINYWSKRKGEENLCHLDILWKNGVINKGCVESEQKLTNYLDYLVMRGLIDKHGKRPNTRYTLSNKYIVEAHKNNLRARIDRWDHTEFLDERHVYKYLNKPDNFQLNYQNLLDHPDFIDKLGRSWFLFGFTAKMIENLDNNKKTKFYHCLNQIEENMQKIIEIKQSLNKKTQVKWIKNVLKEGKKIDSTYNDEISFYYNGSYSIISKKRMQMVERLFEKAGIDISHIRYEKR